MRQLWLGRRPSLWDPLHPQGAYSASNFLPLMSSAGSWQLAFSGPSQGTRHSHPLGSSQHFLTRGRFTCGQRCDESLLGFPSRLSQREAIDKHQLDKNCNSEGGQVNGTAGVWPGWSMWPLKSPILLPGLCLFWPPHLLRGSVMVRLPGIIWVSSFGDTRCLSSLMSCTGPVPKSV